MKKKSLIIIVFISFLKGSLIAQYWSPLGMGITEPPNGIVNCIAKYNGELYIGGRFLTVGNVAAKGIAKWDGVNWSSVGTGLDRGSEGPTVYALTVFNGELYAAGIFNSAGNTPVSNIAKWNGLNWFSVGDGLSDFVYSLAVYDGQLYAAGLNGVAKWNGVSWETAGTGLYSIIDFVNVLTVYNGSLYAAGNYGGGGGVPQYYEVAKFDGTNWTPSNAQPNGSIYAMIEYNGELYIGGDFTKTGNDSTKHIAKWNGVTWSALPKQLNLTWVLGQCPIDPSDMPCDPWYVASSVLSLEVYNGSLYAGGSFNSADTVYTRNIAKWNGSNWSALKAGVNNTVHSLASEDTTLYVGGVFNYADGTIPAKKIARWNDTCTTAPPQPMVISGSGTPCIGTAQVYSASLVTGATSYTWSLPAGWSGISNSNSITVQTGLNSGSISVVASNSCGASVPQTILITTGTIPAMPALINGNDTVCEGSSQTYFIDPVPGATGYAWDLTFGTAFGFDSTIITITPQHSGYPDDFITVSAYNHCGNSDLLTLPVKVNHIPYQPNRIFGNIPVCRGSNQTYFIDPVPGATSYTWTIPSGWIGNSNTSSINVNVGNATGEILVSANNTCGTGAFKSLQVLFDTIPSKPGPINGNAYVTVGEKHGYSVDITNRPLGYNWLLSGGGDLTAGQSPHKVEIDWRTPGTYVLSVNAVNSCGVSTEQKMNVIVAGANEKDPYSLQLFPNPSTGVFYLKAKRLQDKWISVEVASMSGQLIYRSERIIGSNNYTQLIDLDKMSAGLYVVKIIVNDQAYVKKISIIR